MPPSQTETKLRAKAGTHDPALPLTIYARPDATLAVRGGQAISQAEFYRDVTALAARLPAQRYILNLCSDRYRFMVGFAAALLRQQISLMPPGTAPAMLAGLAEDYPDIYALTDTAPPALNFFPFPDDLDGPCTCLMPVPEHQQALILFTSGSTDKPKPVGKCWGTLVRSARAAGARLGIAELKHATVIGTVPHQHSYGLESVILLGLQHGLTIDASAPLYPADIRAALARAPRPRILVTTPVHLRTLLAEPGNMPPADLILSATAPLSAELATQSENVFGARLIEIYGCTEAGQVATRRTAWQAEWHCLDGVALRQDRLASWAEGSAVEGIAPLQDTITLTGTDKFLLGERSSDLVDVAGKRTSLAYLNHQLLSIAGVQDGVFLMGTSDGKRVARLLALVVAPEVSRASLLRALRARLDPAFLPRPLVLVETLPRNALGKLPREALLRLAAGQGDA